MPDNISSARIEPLGSSAEKETEYPRPKERRKANAVKEKPKPPIVEAGNEEEHRLDEQA
jgi:hypothetical protein